MKLNANLYEKRNGIYRMKDGIAAPTGTVVLLLQDLVTGRVVEEIYKNLFVSAGRNAIADRLKGTTTGNKGIITYCSLGTGTNGVTLADTQLQTELVRKLVSVRTRTGNRADFQTFFGTAEGNGDLKEAGLFGDDASATANSGTLYARTAINRTKLVSQTLTLYWSVTIGG